MRTLQGRSTCSTTWTGKVKSIANSRPFVTCSTPVQARQQLLLTLWDCKAWVAYCDVYLVRRRRISLAERGLEAAGEVTVLTQLPKLALQQTQFSGFTAYAHTHLQQLLPAPHPFVAGA